MTRDEFENWKAVTMMSAHHWTVDEIHNGRDGQDLLMFKGGEDGTYITIQPNGLVELGTYEGALPHIGEAVFRPVGTQQCKDFNDAGIRVLRAINEQDILATYFTG